MKKSRIFIYPLIIMGLVLMLTNSCKKKEEVPVVVTTSVTEITKTTATSGGSITSDGGASITARGVCWSTGATPTTADSKTSDGTGTVSFSSAITGLTAGTTYNVRAYATNSAGTAYGSAKSFTTLPLEVPVLTTTAITAITSTSATSGGNITDDGGSAVTARGVCWGTAADPTIDDSKTTDGDGTGAFTSSLTDLTPGTTYYVRAYATNSAGTGYGAAVSFLASGLPTLTTSAISNLEMTSVTSGGNIESDGGSAITVRGVCWSTSENPTTADSKTEDGSGTGSFTSSISDLTGATTYYIRAYATNASETGYGNQVTFTTLGENQVADYDGNVYNYVTIGTQTWMVENFRCTHYSDGTPIPNVTEGTEWVALTSDAYCYYNNKDSAIDVFGAIYNWYAVTSSNNIAPAGWHVPTMAEWDTLGSYYLDYIECGAAIKEAGTTHWNIDTGATNSSGFTAVAAGIRDVDENGTFGYQMDFTGWWNQDAGDLANEDRVGIAQMHDWGDGALSSNDQLKILGLSLRLVKNSK
jgi:uncharacterized protein (TIGR02145 family)